VVLDNFSTIKQWSTFLNKNSSGTQPALISWSQILGPQKQLIHRGHARVNPLLQNHKHGTCQNINGKKSYYIAETSAVKPPAELGACY
jgi:hypothetical protein